MPVDDRADPNAGYHGLKKDIERLQRGTAGGGDGEHLGSGAFSLQLGDSADASGDRSSALGPGSWAPGENGTSAGHNSYAGGADSTAVGEEAYVADAHDRSFAYGANATTEDADEGRLGADYHTVVVPGKFRVASNPPASSSAAGLEGQMSWDSGYWYVCVSTNSWKRIALTTF